MTLPRHIGGGFPVTIQLHNDCVCQTSTKYSVPVSTSIAATCPVWVTVARHKTCTLHFGSSAYKLQTSITFISRLNALDYTKLRGSSQPVVPYTHTHTQHWFKITLPNTDQAHDKHKWTTTNFSQVELYTPWWWIAYDPKHVGVIFNFMYFKLLYNVDFNL